MISCADPSQSTHSWHCCSSPRVLYALTIASFVILCLPPVTQALAYNWMYLALGMAWLIGLGVVHRRSVRSTHGTTHTHHGVITLHWLIFAAYCVHQFEEHGYDIFGNAYAFMNSINGIIGPHVDCAPGTLCPLDPPVILYVNTVMVWLPFLLAIWGGERSRYAGLAAVGIPATNAVVHTVAGIAHQSYNPGLLTSWILFAPLCVLYYRTLAQHGQLTRKHFAFSIAYGLGCHVLLMGLAVATNVAHVIPQWVYPIIVGLYAVFPACLDHACCWRRANKG